MIARLLAAEVVQMSGTPLPRQNPSQDCARDVNQRDTSAQPIHDTALPGNSAGGSSAPALFMRAVAMT